MREEQLRVKLEQLATDVRKETDFQVDWDNVSAVGLSEVCRANGKLDIVNRILAILSDSDASDAEKGSESGV